MSLRRDGDVIYFEGHCRVEDAEVLVTLIEPSNDVQLDLTACESLHAAVAQAILVFGCQIVGAPGNGFLKDHLAPALAQAIKTEL